VAESGDEVQPERGAEVPAGCEDAEAGFCAGDHATIGENELHGLFASRGGDLREALEDAGLAEGESLDGAGRGEMEQTL